MKHQRGAALLVILLIAGVLGAFFAIRALTGASAERDKVTTTALAQAKEALIGFAVRNGRLPRPATSSVSGVEMPAPCVTEAACTGLIPWTTLGVSKLDGSAKVIRYSVTPAFADAGFTLTTTASKKVQTRDTAGALVYLAGTAAACTPATGCVPAVIFSHGKSNFGTTDAGAAIPNLSTTNLDEITNNSGAGPGVTFIQRMPSENTASAGGEFDDIVTWLPLGILLTRMNQAGIL